MMRFRPGMLQMWMEEMNGGAAPDTTAPMVTGFAATTPSIGGTIAITEFTATDDVGVTGYMITESDTQPESDAEGWSETAPETHVAADGSCTLYPWAKDAAGNVSDVYGSPVAVEVYETPAYENAGGTGDRTATITASTNAIFGGPGGTAAAMVNGVIGESIWFIAAGQDVAGKYVQFQFPVKAIITEIKIYLNNTSAQGTWKIQGSNNGTDWSDIGDPFTFGGATTQTLSFVNATGYSYYRLLGVSGTSVAQYFREFEFKIGNFLA